MHKKLIRFLLSDKKFIISVSLLIVVATVVAQSFPYLQGIIVNQLLDDDSTLNYIVTILLITFCVMFLDILCKFVIDSIMATKAFNYSKKVKNNVFAQILNKPYDFFEQNRTGDILYKINTYVYDLGNYVADNVAIYIVNIARTIVIFTFMLILDFKISSYLVVWYLLIILVIAIFSKKINKYAIKYKRWEVYRNSIILQHIAGVETFLAYNTSYEKMTVYQEVCQKASVHRRNFYRFYNIFNVIIDFLVCLGIIMIYLIAMKTQVSVLQVGVIVSLISYATKLMGPMQKIVDLTHNWVEAEAVSSEIFSYTESNSSLKQKHIDVKFENVSCELKNVYFQNEDVVFENLNLNVEKGEKILITNKHLKQRSAILKLLTGLYLPQKGKVYYNKIEFSKISSKSIKNFMSVLTEQVSVLDDSVYNNLILFNPKANQDQIVYAMNISGLNEVVSKMDKGIYSKVSNAKMSEGDKEVLAYARILLKNTPLLICLDCALDMQQKNRHRFHKSLEKFCKDKTLIYISEHSIPEINFTKKIQLKDLVENQIK